MDFTYLVIGLGVSFVGAVCLYKFRVPNEILAALIGAVVLIIGYIYTTNRQYNLEQYKMKSTAYVNFITQLNLNLHDPRESKSVYNDKVNKINAAFMSLETIAPACVIKNIESNVFHNSSTTIRYIEIQMMEFILNNDLYGKNSCENDELTPNSFMFFYPN